MVVKFFSNKKGGSSKAIDYLLNHREQQGTAKVLQGDPQLTRQIINSIQYKQKTTVGCLSFEEKNISEDLKHQLIADFENHLLPGLEKEQYNILWVEHRDKGRLELNFVIPKIELTTQKSLNPYYHKADLPRVEKWQDLQNLKYEFSNPKDPIKARTLQTNSKEVGLSKDYEQLDKLLHNLAEQGQIKNREHLIELLKSNSIEVTRKGKDYLSIKLPDSKKAKKFKGSIYDEQFTSIREIETISEKAEQRAREFNNRDTQAEQQRITGELESYTRAKEQKLRAIYPSARARIKEEHRQTSNEFNRDTQEQTPKHRGDDKREAREREQVENDFIDISNIHFNDISNIRDSISNNDKTVQSTKSNDILFLQNRTQQGAVNDSTRTSIKPRTPTRESTQYKAYINTRQTRIGIYTDTTKRAKVIRAKYQEYNNQQSAVCEAVAPRISANDEDRERSLLIKARENYRAFESFKRIAERVTERVREIGEKIIQTGSRIANFFNGRANERAERAEQERLKRDTEQHKSKVRDYGHYSSR